MVIPSRCLVPFNSQCKKLTCGPWLGEGPAGEATLVNPLGAAGGLPPSTGSLIWPLFPPQGLWPHGGMLACQATKWLDPLS